MPLIRQITKPTFSEGVKLLFGNSNLDTNPGSGIFFLDNATQNMSMWIYVSTLDVNGVDITSFLDSLDDSTNPSIKGSIKLTNFNNPNIWMQGSLTSVIVAPTYRKLAVTYNSFSTINPFLNNDTIVLSFTRAGDVIGSGNYVPVHDQKLYCEQQKTNEKLDQIISMLLRSQ